MASRFRLPPGYGEGGNLVSLQRARACFGGSLGGPIGLPRGMQLVLLCFTNRSGSNYLAELLATSGQVNRAKEMLNADEIGRVSQGHGIPSFFRYFSDVARHDMRGMVFIIKVMMPDLAVLIDCGLLDHNREQVAFLMMEREDRLGQAISLEIARQTESWVSTIPARRPVEALEFSAGRIAGMMGAIAATNRMFDVFFETNGVAPTRVVYERVLRAPQEEASVIAARLGWPGIRADPARVPIERQAGAANAAWREMYLGASRGG